MASEGGAATQSAKEAETQNARGESVGAMSETETTVSMAERNDAAAVSTHHGIVVLDFGGQYTQLIARRIREQEVFSAILPCTASLDEIRKLEPAGVVLSGGPSSVYDPGAPVCNPAILHLGVPVLGIMVWPTMDNEGNSRRRAGFFGPAR